MPKKSTGPSLAALEKQIAHLRAEADKLLQQEIDGVVGRIQEAITHYGLTPEQLFGAKQGRGGNRRGVAAAGPGPATATAVGVAKYRDPTSGKTWTGRGKPPAWIAGVADRSPFEIAGAARAERKKPGPKSAGIPKYRDPVSGKTWTGNGKAPGWIAGAADRSTFLIEQSAVASA